MNKVGDIFTELSDRYGLHRSIIIEICSHPFRFASRRIADPDDEKSIMLHYFGKFRMKRRLLGSKKQWYEEVNKIKRDRQIEKNK